MPDPLHVRLRQILLEDWDPHDAARSEFARGTYDAYLAPLLELLRARPGEEAVMEWLHEREAETMCFPSLGRERLRRAARRLIAAAAT